MSEVNVFKEVVDMCSDIRGLFLIFLKVEVSCNEYMSVLLKMDDKLDVEDMECVRWLLKVKFCFL